MPRIRLFSGLLLLALGLLAAETVEFSARVHARRIGLDDPLVLTLTLKGVDNPPPPDLSSLADFTVQSRSQSTEFRMVNGRTSHLTHFEYRLIPRHTGTLTVPSIRYEVNGRTLVTSPVSVEVVPGSVAPPPGRSLFDDDLMDFPGMRRRQNEPVDVRLEAEVEPRRVVPGQQVMVRILLRTRNGNVRQVNLNSEPSIPGFWQEWFPVPPSTPGREVEVNGRVYQEYEIRRVALFPNETGEFTIPALQFEVLLGDGGFGFFSEPRRIRRSTDPVTLQVDPLPPEAAGLPVGDFRLSFDPPPAAARVGDMVTLKLRITGDGNMKTLAVPEAAGGPFFQVFPPRIKRTLDYSGKRLRGTVAVEIPLAFRRNGAVSLPPLVLRWWNPATRRVESAETPPRQVTVTGRPAGVPGSPATPGAEVVRRGRDIFHIAGGAIHDQSRRWYRSRWYGILLWLSFLTSLGAGLYRWIWEPLVRRSRRLEARRLLFRTLRRLRKLPELGAAAGIVENYLRERTGLAPSRMNAAAIARVLEERGAGDAEIREFLALKTQADSLRYSPLPAAGGDRSALERLVRLLRRMDKQIR